MGRLTTFIAKLQEDLHNKKEESYMQIEMYGDEKLEKKVIKHINKLGLPYEIEIQSPFIDEDDYGYDRKYIVVTLIGG